MEKIKTILSKVKIPKVKIPNLNLKPLVEKLKPIVSKVWEILKKTPNLGLKALKGFIKWFGKAVKESIAQLWTLLGFFIAWLTLTGTAQQIVGIATVISTILWLATISLREEKE
jgi:hypothetical protein